MKSVGIESELEMLKKLMEEEGEEKEDGEEEKQSERQREEKRGGGSWVQTAVLCHTQTSHLCSRFPSKYLLFPAGAKGS